MSIWSKAKALFREEETRNMPLDVLDRWIQFLQGGHSSPSWSGEQVSPKTAQQLSVVYNCISLIAETAASLPLHVYRRRPDGSQVVAKNHYLYPLLHDRANPFSAAQTFREAMLRNALGWGHGAALKEFDAAGRTRAVYLIRPDRFKAEWDMETRTLGFAYYPENGEQIVLQPSQVHYLPGPSSNGVTGESVIQHYAYQSMGAALGARKSNAKFFANGLRASGILSHPAKIADRKALRDSVYAQIGGDSKLGLLVLEEGMKFDQTSVNPEDAQLLETLDAQDHELCRWFRVPPVLAGVVSKTTSWGTGIEQLNIGFLQYTMTPWLKRVEGAIANDLIGYPNNGIFAEHDVAGLLRGDLKSQAEHLRALKDGGIMTRNEARRKLNLPPVEGGDVFDVPLNTQLVDEGGDVVMGGEQQADAEAVDDDTDGD